ncbi:MAG: WD40/YVTN/BNR-like repeat-containing protein [Acidobacteriaceae bacterium]
MRSHIWTWLACGFALGTFFGATTLAHAQWQIERSGTTAGLRGIHAVNASIAWASGTDGTVLRTLDGGQNWQLCRTPNGAEKLDFRSVWAWDGDHAMAMSSGPGSESRLYSTHDGCRTWRLVFSNPDADGFWDALQFDGTRFGVILGDPVHGSFTLFVTYDGGNRWTRQVNPCLRAITPTQGAFAASNESLAIVPIEEANSQPGVSVNHQIWFGTSGGWLYGFELAPLETIAAGRGDSAENGCTHVQPLPGTVSSAGIFAISLHDKVYGVAVGGDYAQPHRGSKTAAFTIDGVHWRVATHPPVGYRSTSAWNATDGTWIAAGPTGSDISRDNGNTWQSLDHGNWNALSLPFAVGPDGRIARLLSWGQLRVSNQVPEAVAAAPFKE